MPQQPIRFDDGAGYERMMGIWSRLAGEQFLDWLAPTQGLRWVDVGCGNGAFTELLATRCAPAGLEGIDPSEGQVAYARTRPGAAGATFRQGDALALPFATDSFDAAAMALVIFFVPDPPRGVAEMVRVTRPGGLVCAYAWDLPGGGFPYEPISAEMRALGQAPVLPPHPEVSETTALAALWHAAGLADVTTHTITVRRGFSDFTAFWDAATGLASFKALREGMSEAEFAAFQDRVRARLPADANGRVTCEARANAVRGRVPA